MTKSTSPYSLTNYLQVNSDGVKDPQSQSAWTSGFDNYYLGMVTNAFDVTTGADIPPKSWEWGPADTKAPKLRGKDENSDVYWVFGGVDGSINEKWGL